LQHRVKNNLQLIVALIRLEARNERRGEKVNLQTLAGRIESLHLLYQALFERWRRRRDRPRPLLEPDRRRRHEHLRGRRIRLDQKMDYAPVSVNTALSVGLVVNELLTNSFKYAFDGRGQGVIRVECLRQIDDRYHVVIADDGVGLPEGVAWPVPGKIGALIVQTLRENAKTDFNVESAPGRGVRATMNVDRKIAARNPL
jgi:two-component sensor histidine kinase